MTSKKKKKVGRPSEYKSEYCQLLIDHMAQGYSFEAFGGAILKAKDTLYRWVKEFPEFSDAKKIGDAACQYFWERKGIEGNETIKDPDGMTVTRSIPPAIWIFNVKNRFGWRDVQEIKSDVKANVTTEDKAAKEVKELTSVLVELMKEK